MDLFDLHCDTLTRGVRPCAPFIDWVQTFAAFLPDGLSCGQALTRYRTLVDTARRWEREAPAAFRIFRGTYAPCGCTAMLSVENGGMLGSVEGIFDRFRSDHIRVVGLTWNGDNAWASGCRGTPDGGLTACGVAAVGALEMSGITVDVSHLNERGFWQVEGIAMHPYIATHSNAAAVTPHPRNLTDDQFRAIRDRGGLVGFNVYPPFLGDHSPQAFCRHVEHFLSLGGERTVCVGSDIDGFDTPPIAWDYLAILYEFMTAEGYAPTLIEDLFYGNARRFFDRAMI